MNTYLTSPSLRRLVGDEPSGLLRLALRLDAVASGACGLLALVAGHLLADLLGTPPSLLGPVGLFLVIYAAALVAIAARRQVSLPAAWTVIVFNLLWAVASLAVVIGGWLPLTGLGVAAVLAQAVAVTLLADLQFLGVRRVQVAIGLPKTS